MSKSSIEKWRAVTFQSSCSKTPEFKAFAAAYRAAVRKQLASEGLELVKWNNGHFYCSWFALNPETGRFVYGCCSDVRYFPDDWFTHILYRTATGVHDFTGGRNRYTTLALLGADAHDLTVTHGGAA